MPYKVFVAGEEALAADANSYLMSQTVARFTNATQRTSQLTAPVLNQLSMLDSRPGLSQYWTGSAWADVVPFIQSGALGGSTNATGDISLVYPTPFAAAAILSLLDGNPGSNDAFPLAFKTVANSASGFTARVLNARDGGAVPSAAMGIHWIAIGTRP